MNSNAPLAEWRRSRGRSLRSKENDPLVSSPASIVFPLHPFKASGPICQRISADGKSYTLHCTGLASVHNTGKPGNLLFFYWKWLLTYCWLIHCDRVSCSAFSLSQTALLLLLPADPFENAMLWPTHGSILHHKILHPHNSFKRFQSHPIHNLCSTASRLSKPRHQS